MKFRKGLFILSIALITIVTITSCPGCANIVPPSGGPRDSLPPMLVSVTPPDSSTSITPKRITFVFNEFVKVENPLANLLVSPTPKVNPMVEGKLRTVTVQIKDTLEPNTTYTIDFGDAIIDVNEGNILRDFVYTFSTGAGIDSLNLSGKVIIAETGKTDSTLIVLLHKNLDDSAVINDRPRYITRLDRNGNFGFHNLPPGSFALYALKDEGGTRRYLSRSQLFAFADEPVNPEISPDSIVLYAYAEKTTSSTPSIITRPVGIRGATAMADRRLRFETNLQDGQLDLLGDLEIRFPAAPLKYFDSSKVRFTTEKFEPIRDYTIGTDTSNRKLTVKHNWIENSIYNIIVEKDFAQDTSGRQLLRTDTLSFRTKKESEYGLVRFRFLNLDLKKNPVLQFVQNGEVKYSRVLSSRDFYAKLFLPGDYELRILFDENNNGKWDPGEFFKNKRQPEKVIPIPRRLTVKANWDNEVDFTLEE